MARSELLEKIRDEYYAAHKLDSSAAIAVFLDFAAIWLANAGILGVGHTANGLALRMRDGSEMLLVETETAPSVADTAAVAIGSGGGVSARQGIGGGESPSVRITGRAQ